jgi:5-hydroxyisourate hydrolase
MSNITTHVLDTAKGKPARQVPVKLERLTPAGLYELVGQGHTDDDGRCRTLVPKDMSVTEGVYRITFDTGVYARDAGGDGFFPEVAITFDVRDAQQHYHVPLLLSPFGYSTYRGS